MTTSTAIPERRSRPPRRNPRAGFSLVELAVAVTIASMALAAVLSTSIFITRSCVATTDYAEMTRQARTALELFARDVRMAKDVTNLGEDGNSVTLTVVTGLGTTKTVDYTYVPRDHTFYQNYTTTTAPTRALITNIESFSLTAYGLATDSSGNPLLANNLLEIKQLQLQLRSVRTGPGRAAASNNVVSARYILRNKITH